MYGLYGRPPAPPDPQVMELALKDYERGQTPITGRAADSLRPEMPQAEGSTRGLARDIGDVLTYALYPVTGLRFLRVKYGLEAPPEEAPQAAPSPAAPPPAPSPSPRARRFNIFVGERHFQVTVDPEGPGGVAQRAAAPLPGRPAPSSPTPPPAAAQAPGASLAPKPPAVAEGEAGVVAPMPGMVVRYAVAEGQQVAEGQTVVILEAMKMENALPAPRAGVVKALRFSPGSRVQRGEILAIIG